MSRDDAQELAQEAYLKLLGLERPPEASRAYLFRIASNLLIDRIRRKAVDNRALRDLHTLSLDSERCDPERQVIALDHLRRVRGYLSELPERYRTAYVLYREKDLSQDEIATSLGVTARQVRNFLTDTLIYCRLRADGYSDADSRRQCKTLT